ncbi:MAG: amino acid permease [Thermoproteota archaeon]|nr:amino acid permease [Candidatus Brockarchaeota archaeon]
MSEEAKPTLKRKLNLVDAISIGIGAIIGAGIFVLIGVAAGLAGPAVFIAVIISGLSATFTALSFSELGSALPKAGGVYEYGHELISPSIGFVLGWMWIFGNIVLGATASLGFGFYVSSIFSFIPFKVGAAIVILFVVLINIIGVKQSAIVNNVIVLIKVGVLILFVILGLPKIKLSYFDDLFPNGFIPLLQAAALFYFAYIGFPRISTTAEEVKNPEKNIPLAILFSLFVSSVIYLFTSITAVGLIGYKSLGSSSTPVADAASELGIRGIVTLGALCATFSVILTSVMGQSRIFFAMARNEEMPHMLSKIHSKFETPVYSILVSGLIMLTLALTVDISNLAYLGSFSVLFTHVFTNYASIKLSKLNLDNSNYFKVPFRPFHAFLGLLLSFVLLISSGLTTIASGIFVCILGFVWYYSYKKINVTTIPKIFSS